jgi:GT2 family glycosyltransferase
MVEPFEASGEVLGAGGAVIPEWEDDASWLPDELLWVVGCTYLGHRKTAGPIRNPIGCNMAFRRRELTEVGGFSTEFGKSRGTLNTCDETEVCLRLERAHGRGRIRCVPEARVRHHIPAARIGWKTLAVRSVSEGLSKRRLRRLYGAAAVGAERSYALRLLTRSLPRLLVQGALRRDRRSMAGAAAIVLSLAVTGLTYLGGDLAGRADA